MSTTYQSGEAHTDPLIETPGTNYSSPSRKAKKQVNYAESDEDEDEDLKPSTGNRRAAKRRRISARDDDSDDEFGLDAGTQAALESDEGTLSLCSLPRTTYETCFSTIHASDSTR